MQYSHVITRPEGHQLYVVDHAETRRALRRKHASYDGICWRFDTSASKALKSARYEVEGIGTVHHPGTAVSPPATPSNVLVCSFGRLHYGPCSMRLDEANVSALDAAGLATKLMNAGAGDRPILLDGYIYPDAEQLRQHASAAVILTFNFEGSPLSGPSRYMSLLALKEHFGGQIGIHSVPLPGRASATLQTLTYADELQGMLAASALSPHHPEAARLRTVCNEHPTLASALEAALESPHDEAAIDMLRVVWKMVR